MREYKKGCEKNMLKIENYWRSHKTAFVEGKKWKDSMANI